MDRESFDSTGKPGRLGGSFEGCLGICLRILHSIIPGLNHLLSWETRVYFSGSFIIDGGLVSFEVIKTGNSVHSFTSDLGLSSSYFLSFSLSFSWSQTAVSKVSNEVRSNCSKQNARETHGLSTLQGKESFVPKVGLTSFSRRLRPFATESQVEENCFRVWRWLCCLRRHC